VQGCKYDTVDLFANWDIPTQVIVGFGVDAPTSPTRVFVRGAFKVCGCWTYSDFATVHTVLHTLHQLDPVQHPNPHRIK